ncbi:peptidoglycan bridge formation glycyltransferase FemA/FemB family protein [Patescibacteria group bacterium]|nr:peptidoglycan bridge formation glycyltransferase FemA/FemB family protein [Patescibacteria group bacterium]
MKVMQVIEIFSQKTWNDFIITNKGQFLQSWQWGDFQEKLGRKVWRLGIKNNNQIIGQALVVKHNLPLGKNYFYCPRGPLIPASRDSKSKILELLIKEIKEIAKGENAIFWRIEPLNKDVLPKVYDLKFRLVAARPVQPPKTLILDLRKSESRTLSQMHSKTRYNIRLAQRHGIKIFESRDQKDVELFLDLLQQTTKREKFKTYPDNYYHQLLRSDSQFAKLYLAKYQDKVLAIHLLIFFGQTVTYVYGASSREKRQVMAPHLLHWEVIRQAKEQGYQFYDFWGIDEKKWPGLTRFKMSFGGQPVAYPGTFDMPFSKTWYCLYKIGKFIRT